MLLILFAEVFYNDKQRGIHKITLQNRNLY